MSQRYQRKSDDKKFKLKKNQPNIFQIYFNKKTNKSFRNEKKRNKIFTISSTKRYKSHKGKKLHLWLINVVHHSSRMTRRSRRSHFHHHLSRTS